MNERAVLVSGASSGIGNATAKRLAGDGFVVFAGVRNENDARTVAEHQGNLRPVMLDVTDPASIDAAIATVRESGIPLYGLLSNAGIAVGGPLEYLPIEELRRQFEVNTFGPIALIQAAMPMLRASHGRIVCVGSIAGRFGPPFVGPYSASKAALATLVDSLRMEVAQYGIDVTLFEFAAVKTPIWEKGRSHKGELERRLPAQALRDYAPFVEAVSRQIDREERVGLDPATIAAAIAGAFSARKPRARYVIGKRAKIQAAVALLPHRTRDRIVRKVLRIP